MITWSDNYIMGIKQFDYEHKQLFHLAEQILSKMRISNRNHPDTHMFVIREAVTYINSYFERHAKEEEAYMRSIGYEGYALHKMLHDDFQNGQLVKYRQIIESGQCRESDVWDFIGSGVGWLLEHIATADMAIVGKGILAQPPQPRMDHTALDRESDVWDFIGSGVGWLLEHIATADMAIVGKGILAQPPQPRMDHTALEQEINLLFASTLNIEANAKIASTQDMAIVGKGILAQPPQPRMDHTALEQEINLLFASTLNIEANAKIASTQYAGEYYGKAIHQKMVYQTDKGEVSVISGIERTFLLDVAHMLYGETMEDEVELILSTLQSFGPHFWGTLGRRFAGNDGQISIKETQLLPGGMVHDELNQLQPTISLLFTSDKGKFSVASNYVSPSMAI